MTTQLCWVSNRDVSNWGVLTIKYFTATYQLHFVISNVFVCARYRMHILRAKRKFMSYLKLEELIQIFKMCLHHENGGSNVLA